MKKSHEMRRAGYIGMHTLTGISLFLVCVAALAATPLLTPVLKLDKAIAGARIGAATDMLAPPQRKPEFAGYLAWQSPAAIGGRGTYFFVFDSGHQQIFRYDLAQQTMAVFAPYPAPKVTGLAVAADLSVYVADTGTQKITHFSRDGKPLQTFGNPREMARPVAVAVDEVSGQVLVADELYSQVVVFNSLGLMLSIIKPDELRSLAAMARGPDGLYLVDRLERKIVVVGKDGKAHTVFGEEFLKDPAAIAVDRFNRVFVADNFDHTIKVFVDEELAVTFGGSGTSPGLFNRIGGLWLEQNTLYVADSLNGRVQSFQVAPPSAPYTPKPYTPKQDAPKQ